jgi:7-keto-8-aminopelargonate synthetase-like enzyme
MLWFIVNSPHVAQATQIDMIMGSVANGLNSSGGFCAGSHIVVDHQRVIGTSFVFSAAVPALLAVSASEGINILRNTPSILSTLPENVRAIRSVLDRHHTFLSRRFADHPYLSTCDLRRRRRLRP